MNFKLPDVSFWQDDPTTPKPIDFQKMAQKTRGVIIRAGQGIFEDRVFKTSWANARRAGLLRGSYWFYDSRVHPKRQAEKFVTVLGDDLGEMEMWCDFEDRYGGEYGGWRNWYSFMANLQLMIPDKDLGVYTGYYYWNEFARDVDWFGQFPLWQAWYNTDIPPLVPSVWNKWTFHQYTDDHPGKEWGVESREIDLNYFDGTEADFLARYGVQTPPEPEPEPARIVLAKFGDKLLQYKETKS